MQHKFEPFQKVLVRNYINNEWICNFYSHYHPRCEEPYVCTWSAWKCCIPYEGNEYLLGTTDSPEQKHEYKRGDNVEVCWAGIWHIGMYLTKKENEHVVYSFVDDSVYHAKDNEIRPFKED